jgi:hypothetical protein
MKKSLWRGVKVVGLILWVSNIYDISSMRTTNIYHNEDVDICRSRLYYAMQIHREAMLWNICRTSTDIFHAGCESP